MSPETKILLEEFKKEFKSYKDYVDVSPWMNDVNTHPTKGYLYSNKLLTEISLIETIMKSLSKFKEDVGEDYMLKPIQVFIKDAIKIVEMHLKRIDLYKREYPLDESSGESEVKFHSDLFSQKTKTKVSLSKLNITEKENVAKSPELFFGDDNNKGKYVKAPLLMRETLSEVIPLVKTRTDNLNIDFNIPIINPATSNEMLINMKEKDIPKWDPHKHFFEQELSVIQFWQEEINKIKNGINIGGYHIHPWLYWHLNIFKFAWGAGKDKYPKNPAFRDNEYFFTEMLKMAEEDGRKGILMYGSRRISKALKNDEKLYYYDGSIRNIGDSKKGDIIIGGDGKPTTILGVYPQGEVDLYKISFEDGRSIVCCKDHLWEVYDLQADKMKTLPLKEIMKKYKYKRIHSGKKYKDGKDREKNCFNYYIPLLTNPIELNTYDIPFIDPYYFGLWLGDGSERNLTITNIDQPIIDHISNFSDENDLNFIQCGFSYKCTKKSGKFNKVWDIFKDKNLNENKHIPIECYNWSVEDRFNLLRGLMDSDGTVSNNGDISFCNINKNLIDGVEKLIRELGIGCKVFEKKGSYLKKDNTFNKYYLIRLYTDKKVFNLDRKLSRISSTNVRNYSKRNRTAIINIEYYGKDEATCIRVDNEDSLFLTTNSIVTHNSVVMASYLMRTLYTVRNAKCTVLGFTFNPDLKAITDYMQESITNMVPAFKINVNNNDTEKQILLGLKAKNGTDRYDYSTLTITNLEDGSKKGGQKSAGPTPDAWAMDEIAKGDCITVYNAAKPSFAGGENGKWRLIPLLAGCVCAGTKVYNHKGELKNIEDLQQEEGILGYNIDSQKLTKEPITWMQPPSEKPCYRITTRRKHVLECSYEHPILVRHRNKQEKRNEKWVRKIEFIPTEELKIGQQIVINEEVNIWGDKVMWEPRMVGWFIGDGHYGYNEVPSISSCDFEINKYISSKYNTSNKKSPSVTKNGKEFLQRRIKGTGKYLRELGIYGQTKCNKTLPINIYEYRRQDLVELLGGLFDTDGYATVGGNCPTVGFTSGCENLVIEVKNLLNKLGIHPTYNKKLYKSNELINKKSEGYNLTISDKKSLETFHKHIKFSIGYKQDNLNKIIELNKYKKEQIPSELNNCRLDTISNIEYIGVKPIYNLTAGSTNTYIANGIVTHNTAGEAALSVSAEKMLKNPEGFDLLPMNWDLLEKHVDPDSITWTRDKFPYFVPAQLSLETGDKIKTTLGDFLGEDELSPLQDIYMEKTDWISAKKFYEEKRLKLENDIQLLASEVNSFPLKVEDCYLSTEKNKFPGLESKRRKDYIEEFGLWGEKGWIEKTYDGFYNFVIDNSKDIIWEYPYKGGNFDAPIVILDDPRPNDIEPPLGLYCIGFDDVKQDTSDGDSVISATIFKRSFEGGEWANRIVGWYDSRPDRKRDYYKNLYLLIKYFNARVLHENEDNNFIDYMETNHYDDLYIHMSDGIGLASEENFNKNKNRKWGWSPHGSNIYHLEQKIVAYTKEDGIIIGDEEGLSGIDRINHPMLLYEFYKYKKGKNADRIRSFGLALTLAQYYDKTNQYIKGRKKQIEHDIDTIKKNNVKLSKGLSYTKNLVKY